MKPSLLRGLPSQPATRRHLRQDEQESLRAPVGPHRSTYGFLTRLGRAGFLSPVRCEPYLTGRQQAKEPVPKLSIIAENPGGAMMGGMHERTSSDRVHLRCMPYTHPFCTLVKLWSLFLEAGLVGFYFRGGRLPEDGGEHGGDFCTQGLFGELGDFVLSGGELTRYVRSERFEGFV